MVVVTAARASVGKRGSAEIIGVLPSAGGSRWFSRNLLTSELRRPPSPIRPVLAACWRESPPSSCTMRDYGVAIFHRDSMENWCLLAPGDCPKTSPPFRGSSSVDRARRSATTRSWSLIPYLLHQSSPPRQRPEDCHAEARVQRTKAASRLRRQYDMARSHSYSAGLRPSGHKRLSPGCISMTLLSSRPVSTVTPSLEIRPDFLLMIWLGVLLALVAILGGRRVHVPVLKPGSPRLHLLDRQPGWQSSIGEVSAGFGKLKVTDLHLQANGAVLTLPSLEAQLPLSKAAREHGIKACRVSWPRAGRARF